MFSGLVLNNFRFLVILTCVLSLVMLMELLEHLSASSNEQNQESMIKRSSNKDHVGNVQSTIARSPKFRTINHKLPRRYGPVRKPLISHRTRFMHHGIVMDQWSDPKRNGLVTKMDILSGEILLVESPVLLFKSLFNSLQINFQREVLKKLFDAEFVRIWDTMDGKQAFDHLVQFDVHQLFRRVAIFQMFTKINYGTVPNVVAVFGEGAHELLCVVIAIKNIPRGSKLIVSKINTPSLSAALRRFIDSGQIFKMLNRVHRVNPPNSSGDRLTQRALCALNRQSVVAHNKLWQRWCKNVAA